MPAEQRNPQPESWVVNWSERQKCFHVETVEEMLFQNRRNFAQQSQVDVVPLYFAASLSDANEAAEAYRQRRGIPPLQDEFPDSTR